MNYFQKLVKNTPGNVFIIAEACDNHMGSLDMAKYLARAAKLSGADAVKFQHHLVDEEMIKNSVSSSNFSEPLYDFLKRNSLSLEDHIVLKKFCDDLDILYLCTPFSFQAAKEIHDLVPFFKIGSGEFQDFWFIDNLKLLNKPILFSCGMSTKDEILNWKLRYHDLDFALLNTLSEYPPVLQDMNISFIEDLRLMFGPNVIIGHSDHTQTTWTSVLAVSKGAQIIEKHITLSHYIFGPDKDVSLDVNEFQLLVNEVKKVILTLGNNKILNENEKAIRNWAYRSVVYSKSLASGHVITSEDIKTKRPGNGEILSRDYESLIGKKLKMDVNFNCQVKKNDYE